MFLEGLLSCFKTCSFCCLGLTAGAIWPTKNKESGCTTAFESICNGSPGLLNLLPSVQEPANCLRKSQDRICNVKPLCLDKPAVFCFFNLCVNVCSSIP